MTSPYLNRPLRSESQARADIFALGVKYAHLKLAGKSTSGVLMRARLTPAQLTPAQRSLARICAKYI